MSVHFDSFNSSVYLSFDFQIPMAYQTANIRPPSLGDIQDNLSNIEDPDKLFFQNRDDSNNFQVIEFTYCTKNKS